MKTRSAFFKDALTMCLSITDTEDQQKTWYWSRRYHKTQVKNKSRQLITDQKGDITFLQEDIIKKIRLTLFSVK